MSSQAFRVRTLMSEVTTDQRLRVFCPSVIRTSDLYTPLVPNGTAPLNGAFGLSRLKPQASPVVTFVLPAAVMPAIAELMVLVELVSGTIGGRLQDDARAGSGW